MINVTDVIKKAYENSTTQIDKITINNKDYRITNVEYYDDCYLDGNIFGTAIGRMLEFEIENTIELEKAEVKYSTGLLINGIEHWISLGNFIVESIEPNDTTGINKVIAMDYMLKTNIEYESKLDYSSNKITLLRVLQEVCTNSGLELATTSFANSNFIVDSNQFEEGTLNRQVIQAVAQISGTFAKIKSDNKLYLITPKRKGLLLKDVHVITVAELNALPVEKLSACDNEFNLNSYKELVIKRNTHPINLVSLGISDIEGENIVLRDENSISSDGENSLVINDNPFAYTQAKREQLITALFDCVKGFEYTAYEISGQSKPYLETGDEIVAIDKEGNLYNSFLLRFNFKSPKGLESEMSAPSIIKATVEYQNVPDALDIAKRTEIKVDKQNQKIEALVSQQTKTGEKLSKVEQTVDSISQKVENVADLTSKTSGNSIITLKNCMEGSLLELHIYGNNTVFDYLYPADDLYPYGDSRIEVHGFNGISEESTFYDVYELGVTEVLRQNEEVYDEYILKDGRAQVIRRVNKDGTTRAEELIEDLGEFTIPLKDVENVIQIKNYNARIEAKYAIKNTYTDIYATKVEMNSSITQTAEEINLEVRKKVDENEIISSINQSPEAVGIKANKIELSANDILNLLAGNTINLSAQNIILSSKCLTTDKYGRILLKDSESVGAALIITSEDNQSFNSSIRSFGAFFNGPNGYVGIDSDFAVAGGTIQVSPNQEDLDNCTFINNGSIECVKLTQTSLAERKKNIEKLRDNAIDIIKNIDIYKYNLKSENDTDKKHIGFVIGNDYNYSKEVTSLDNQGVDNYSFTSLCCKAIQEQQGVLEQQNETIKQLQKEIKELKEGE